MKAEARSYIRDVRRIRLTGLATEPSYYGTLENLIRELGGSRVVPLPQPKAQEFGIPDFMVQRDDVPIGHVECKDIGTDLDKAEESVQLQRYRDALPNLILTDFLEFRWYANGELRMTAILGEPKSDGGLKSKPGGDLSVTNLFNEFLTATVESVTDPADLAQRMAAKTRLLRDKFLEILSDDQDKSADLKELMNSYREVLIEGLDAPEFADLQAQTVAYGMFAARCLHQGPPADFNRMTAIFLRTTPFLDAVLNQIAGSDADERITWILDDLTRLLARADMDSILKDFGKKNKQQDPIVYFYEDFLQAYDPERRELRGVYYTPEPIVSYIIRSVDHVVRKNFRLQLGLADYSEMETVNSEGESIITPRVLILDPAVGTGTFLREVVSRIRENLSGQAGGWSNYVQEHLLDRIFGFELMMAPYAIAHLKLAIEIFGRRPATLLARQEKAQHILD